MVGVLVLVWQPWELTVKMFTTSFVQIYTLMTLLLARLLALQWGW